MKVEYSLGGGYFAVFEGNSIEPKIVYGLADFAAKLDNQLLYRQEWRSTKKAI